MKLLARAKIVVMEKSSLIIYLGGCLHIEGQGGIINQTKDPKNLLILGTETCRLITIEDQREDFYGAIYAPYADVNIKAGGDIYGAVVGWSSKIKSQSNSTLYYDEDLSRMASMVRYAATWYE
jgi:hypothetical protein